MRELKLCFIGGGNMATALAAGLIGKRCGAGDVLVVDPSEPVRDRWKNQGTEVLSSPGALMGEHGVWIFAVKPQDLKDSIAACKPFLGAGTLVLSVAAGIPAATIAAWLGAEGRPWPKVIRCMPNTPALIASGVTGLVAAPGLSLDDKALGQQLLRGIGEVVWVDTDAEIDAVTALSGSGPAYVFLFIEALIEGGKALGLNDDQARTLALATLNGATQLAALSHESAAVLRERVTSSGGTTAAALEVLEGAGFRSTVQAAMRAA